MNLAEGVLADSWCLAAWFVFVPVLVAALRRAPWRTLTQGSRFNVWLGTIVVLTLLWNLQASVWPGLSLHLVGATVCTLAFGPELAFVGLCAVLAGASQNGAAGWPEFALNALLMGGVGVAVAQAVLRFSERFLPRQIFVYIFANAFFGAALATAATGLASSLLLWLGGAQPAARIFSEYLPYALLLAFSEAWLSGMVVTLYVIYRPDWIASFEDSQYLRD